MFSKRILVQILITYVLLQTVQSDLMKVLQDIGKVNLNAHLSAAVHFILKTVNASEVLIVGCGNYFQSDFNEISQNWRNDVTLVLLNVERNWIVPRKIPKNVFILTFVDQHFAPLLHTFMNNLGVKIRKHKLVFILKSKYFENKGHKLLEEFFSVLWSNKILNFVILRDTKITGDVYSYFPFANDKCREFNEQNIIKMGMFHFNTSGEASFELEHFRNASEYDADAPNSLPFFPNKVPLNLNKCKIIVSTGIWPPSVINVNSNEPGIEIDLILALGQHMNAALAFIVDVQSWHGLAQGEHAEHTGRLGLLKKEAFDLVLGSIPAQTTIFRDFDASPCYLPNSISFVVPRAGIFPSSLILWTMLKRGCISALRHHQLKLLRATKHTTLFLLIAFVVLVISIVVNLMIQMTWKMHLNSKPKESFLLSTIATFLIFIRLLIETSTPTLPQNRTLRWIYGMWFATCLIISCYFNTTLTSFFTEPGRLEQLRTLNDIIDSKIQISLDELYIPILSGSPAQVEYFASKNKKSSVLFGIKLASMGTSVTFTDKLRADHIALQWISSSGERSVYFIDGGSLKYWNNIIYHRGNIFTKRINSLVARINQSGFLEYQKRRYYNRRLLRIMISQYLMVYNHGRGISNDKLINQLNKDFRETRDSTDVANVNGQFLVDTNENDIIQRFKRTDKTLITWDHLSTVFRLWAIGLVTAGVVFVCERVASVNKNIN